MHGSSQKLQFRKLVSDTVINYDISTSININRAITDANVVLNLPISPTLTYTKQYDNIGEYNSWL